MSAGSRREFMSVLSCFRAHERGYLFASSYVITCPYSYSGQTTQTGAQLSELEMEMDAEGEAGVLVFQLRQVAVIFGVDPVEAN